MYPLIESIKLNDGKFHHLDLHQNRINNSIAELSNSKSSISLVEALLTKAYPSKGMHKCRIVYNREIQEIAFSAYKKRDINRIKLIECNEFEYSHKYLERSFFTTLEEKFPDYDEYIITQNGFITDATYANIIFWNGKEWHTPNTPLLKGIQRVYLLSIGLIKEQVITIHDLKKYQKFALINAMMDLNDKIELSIDQLII